MLNCALDRVNIPENTILPYNCDDSDLDYSTSLSRAIDIKISFLIITQLKYDNIMA